ncbi:MAG: InlB B-repeat-containing protein, partial [Clostridia bacterium]|nr:InlB B-repeat-containing protein [Clostridia bacterium]
MKKNFRKWILVSLLCGLCSFGFSACGGMENTSASSNAIDSSIESSVDSSTESIEDSSSEDSSAESEKDKIELVFQTLTVEGNTARGTVSPETEKFSFLNEIIAKGGAKYVVCDNIECQDPILSKTVTLSVGDNTFYVLELVDDEPVHLYTVVIHRNAIYTITYIGRNGGLIAEQQVEEGDFATAPSTMPTEVGYTFVAWNYDFSKPVLSSAAIRSQWQINVYEISYDLQGGTIDEYANPKSYTIETQTITLEEPIKDFAIFSGWYNADNEKVEKISRGSVGNIALTAKWKEFMTHEEFVAAEDEAAVVVKGVVTGIVNTDSKHELYFEDADGGYYAYDL